MDTSSYPINKELIEKRRDIIMSEDYDGISKIYDRFRAADKNNIEYLISEAGVTSNTTIFDFGSGTGNHAIELKQRTGAAVYGHSSRPKSCYNVQRVCACAETRRQGLYYNRIV